MARDIVYAGIDVGTCKITTVISIYDEESDKIRVVGVATKESRGIRKSQVVDIEETIDAVTDSVEAAERMAGFSISDAYISISGSHIQSQNSKGVVAVADSGNEITDDDVSRVIESARAVSLPSSREILHVIPRDFIVDSQPGIKDPVSMTGVRLEAETHIITGASPAIRNLVKCISEIGINVTSVVFSGLASSESVLTETEKELGVCLIDIGGGSTSLTVFTEGALTHTAVLPIGAKHITNDLAIGLRVSLEQAEKIKLALSINPKEKLLLNPSESNDLLNPTKLGVNKEDIAKPSYKTLVDGIIKARLVEIYTMVSAELKKAGLLAATPAGIVLSSGGALTVNADKICKQTMSMAVRTAVLDGTQKTNVQLTGLIDEISSPIFSVAQGLIIYASQQGGSVASSAFSGLGNMIQKIPSQGILKKTIAFVKSFLP